MDSLVVAIPLPNGKGHTLETIDIEYEWKPPRCENCNVFYHSSLHCPKRVVIAKPVDTNKSSAQPSTSGEDGDGFVEVKNRKKKGKDEKVSRNIDGIKFSKPKVQFRQRKQGDSSKRAPNKGTADTPQGGGGNQLEDEDLGFSDGYEDQVFDLPGELKNFRDFKLNMSGRK
ncbi:hypothetical protein Tco_0180117 [Tanacetum coccineum]